MHEISRVASGKEKGVEGVGYEEKYKLKLIGFAAIYKEDCLRESYQEMVKLVPPHDIHPWEKHLSSPNKTYFLMKSIFRQHCCRRHKFWCRLCQT